MPRGGFGLGYSCLSLCCFVVCFVIKSCPATTPPFPSRSIKENLGFLGLVIWTLDCFQSGRKRKDVYVPSTQDMALHHNSVFMLISICLIAEAPLCSLLASSKHVRLIISEWKFSIKLNCIKSEGFNLSL